MSFYFLVAAECQKSTRGAESMLAAPDGRTNPPMRKGAYFWTSSAPDSLAVCILCTRPLQADGSISERRPACLPGKAGSGGGFGRDFREHMMLDCDMMCIEGRLSAKLDASVLTPPDISLVSGMHGQDVAVID